MTPSEIVKRSREISDDYSPHGRHWDADPISGEIAWSHLYQDVLRQIANNEGEPAARKLARAALFAEG